MGGIVQLVIRKDNYKIISLPVWTNSCAIHILKNPNFFRGDFTELEEFINHHNDLIEDYQNNKDSGKFKHPHSRTFGNLPFGLLHPIEYGIIFIDFVDKKIIDMQDYTNSHSLFAGVLRVHSATHLYMNSIEKDKADLYRLDDYISKGFITKITNIYNDFVYTVPKEADGLVYVVQELYPLIKDLEFDGSMNIIEGTDSIMMDFHIDKNGFESFVFKQSNENAKIECYELFKSFNLPMTDEDHKQWQKFIK